jgi:hypothetical protein
MKVKDIVLAVVAVLSYAIFHLDIDNILVIALLVRVLNSKGKKIKL